MSKRQIFNDAIKHLSREQNSDIPAKIRPSTEELVSYADEIFAKLMLSGAAGVSSSVATASHEFPFAA